MTTKANRTPTSKVYATLSAKAIKVDVDADIKISQATAVEKRPVIDN